MVGYCPQSSIVSDCTLTTYNNETNYHNYNQLLFFRSCFGFEDERGLLILSNGEDTDCWVFKSELGKLNDDSPTISLTQTVAGLVCGELSRVR